MTFLYCYILNKYKYMLRNYKQMKLTSVFLLLNRSQHWCERSSKFPIKSNLWLATAQLLLQRLFRRGRAQRQVIEVELLHSTVPNLRCSPRFQFQRRSQSGVVRDRNHMATSHFPSVAFHLLFWETRHKILSGPVLPYSHWRTSERDVDAGRVLIRISTNEKAKCDSNF